jgi:hypothetical protein
MKRSPRIRARLQTCLARKFCFTNLTPLDSGGGIRGWLATPWSGKDVANCPVGSAVELSGAEVLSRPWSPASDLPADSFGGVDDSIWGRLSSFAADAAEGPGGYEKILEALSFAGNSVERSPDLHCETNIVPLGSGHLLALGSLLDGAWPRQIDCQFAPCVMACAADREKASCASSSLRGWRM